MEQANRNITFGQFVTLFPLMTEQSALNTIDSLNRADKPQSIFGEDVPENLNLITFGTYSDLCDDLAESDHIKLIYRVCATLFGASEDKVNYESAIDIWGLCIWVGKEIDRINKLFSSIKMDYTEQERKAGIEQMQFGTFGILDWYARRMGIHDQNDVNSEKWVRLYQCMKNDMEEAKFQRRLQKVYENESKAKRN